jgi:chromosome segregation ATPase
MEYTQQVQRLHELQAQLTSTERRLQDSDAANVKMRLLNNDMQQAIEDLRLRVRDLEDLNSQQANAVTSLQKALTEERAARSDVEAEIAILVSRRTEVATEVERISTAKAAQV